MKKTQAHGIATGRDLVFTRCRLVLTRSDLVKTRSRLKMRVCPQAPQAQDIFPQPVPKLFKKTTPPATSEPFVTRSAALHPERQATSYPHSTGTGQPAGPKPDTAVATRRKHAHKKAPAEAKASAGAYEDERAQLALERKFTYFKFFRALMIRVAKSSVGSISRIFWHHSLHCGYWSFCKV